MRNPESSSARAVRYWVSVIFAAMVRGLVFAVVQREGKIVLLVTQDIHICILLYCDDCAQQTRKAV